MAELKQYSEQYHSSMEKIQEPQASELEIEESLSNLQIILHQLNDKMSFYSEKKDLSKNYEVILSKYSDLDREIRVHFRGLAIIQQNS